ncbi:hypothetical protein [Campylobacter molothri]|uniref:hypothetical protein n=1 Tax=Campylobacter molothri TaxID=1032242 RepID=UPI00301BDCB3|nr:hypothetical protein [Campylobacter sp. RM17709]
MRDLEATLSTDTLGVLRAVWKPFLDLKDYANEVVYTSFESFITQDNKDKKQVFVELLDY